MSSSKANDAPLAIDEQLALFGEEVLNDAEVFSLVFGKTVLQSMEILKEKDFRSLCKMTQKELAEIPGIEKRMAQRIFAAGILFRRTSKSFHNWRAPIHRPIDVAEYVRRKFQGSTQEHFLIIALDARQRALFVKIVAIGSLAKVDVHPREIFRPCIRQGAHSIILAHNHPSGDAAPSQADLELTQRMVEVGKLVGIEVLDHLIVTDHDHCSLQALGLWDF